MQMCIRNLIIFFLSLSLYSNAHATESVDMDWHGGLYRGTPYEIPQELLNAFTSCVLPNLHLMQRPHVDVGLHTFASHLNLEDVLLLTDEEQIELGLLDLVHRVYFSTNYWFNQVPSLNSQPLAFSMNSPQVIDESFLSMRPIFVRIWNLGFGLGANILPEGSLRFLRSYMVPFQQTHRTMWVLPRVREVIPMQFSGPLGEVLNYNEGVDIAFQSIHRSFLEVRRNLEVIQDMLNSDVYTEEEILEIVDAHGELAEAISARNKTTKIQQRKIANQKVEETKKRLRSWVGWLKSMLPIWIRANYNFERLLGDSYPSLLEAYFVFELLEDAVFEGNKALINDNPLSDFFNTSDEDALHMYLLTFQYSAHSYLEQARNLIFPYVNEFMETIGEGSISPLSILGSSIERHFKTPKKKEEVKIEIKFAADEKKHVSKKQNRNQRRKNRNLCVIQQEADSNQNCIVLEEEPELSTTTATTTQSVTNSQIEPENEIGSRGDALQPLTLRKKTKEERKRETNERKKERNRVVFENFQKKKQEQDRKKEQKLEEERKARRIVVSPEQASRIIESLDTDNKRLLLLLFKQPVANYLIKKAEVLKLAADMQDKINEVLGVHSDQFKEDVKKRLHNPHDSTDKGTLLSRFTVMKTRVSFIMYNMIMKGWKAHSSIDRRAVERK